MQVAERFWSKVEKAEGCWVWKGSVTHRGYGRFRMPDRTLSAHRVSWELTNGPIPEGLYVCHTCDNPPCVRPDHLFLGTNEDNQRDSVRKGRAAPAAPERLPRGADHVSRKSPERLARGERQGLARLTDEAVRELRAAHAAALAGRRRVPGGWLAEMGTRYGLSASALKAAIRGKTWGHIT